MKTETIKTNINWFRETLHSSLNSFFENKEYKIPMLPNENRLLKEHTPTVDEYTLFLLALMPHVSPQTLDLFFIQNKELGRPYTEFGGWKDTSHSGFIPTGETAVFLLTIYQPEKREAVIHLLSKEHWF